MNAERKTARGLFLPACLLALAGSVIAAAGLALYAHFGSLLLVQGDNGVSRLFVGEAERMGNAGELDKALALYDSAFQAGFGYPPDKSRAFTLKGLLLWKHGRVSEAAEALSAAASGSAPNFDGASALVEALLRLKRIDEARAVVKRWREAIGDGGTPQTRADMLYGTGRIAQELGDKEEARTAYDESAALVPGGLAEYQIGVLCVDAGNTAEARQHLARFMLGGLAGNEMVKALELCRTLESAPAEKK